MRSLLLLVVLLLCPGRGVAADEGLASLYERGHATLVADLKIGGGDEEDTAPVPFYRPYDLAVGRDGSIYVLDGEECSIVVFDRYGTETRRFSRPGEGPGELRDPFGLALDHRGRVVVYEYGNKRFSRFTTRGEFERSYKFHDLVVSFEYTGSGRMVALVDADDFSAPRPKTRSSLVQLDSTFSVVATIDSITTRRWMVLATSTGVTNVTLPFYEELLWCAGPKGQVCYGRTGAYTLHVVDGDGKPVRTISRSAKPPRVTSEDRRGYYEGLGTMPAAARAALESNLKWPDSKPFFEALFMDRLGYVLVLRTGSEGSEPLLDVFGPDGAFVSTVTIPSFTHRSLFAGDFIYSRVFSDDELPSVVRFRLE